MPVGNLNKVWTSHSCSNFRRTVSPAPPSKRTLSGTTTAARPLISNSVFTCCTKFNCFLLVDAQKSSRTMVVDSRLTSPSSVTNVRSAPSTNRWQQKRKATSARSTWLSQIILLATICSGKSSMLIDRNLRAGSAFVRLRRGSATPKCAWHSFHT